MFLFQKRTRNLIKVIWGIFAVLIILSMVVTYSGFTMLAGTSTQQPQLTQEELDALLAQQATSTATTTVTTAATGTVGATATPIVIPEMPVVPVPATPSVPKLDFSL